MKRKSLKQKLNKNNEDQMTILSNWLTNWQSQQTAYINSIEKNIDDMEKVCKKIKELRTLTKIRFNDIKEVLSNQ